MKLESGVSVKQVCSSPSTVSVILNLKCLIYYILPYIYNMQVSYTVKMDSVLEVQYCIFSSGFWNVIIHS